MEENRKDGSVTARREVEEIKSWSGNGGGIGLFPQGFPYTPWIWKDSRNEKRAEGPAETRFTFR